MPMRNLLGVLWIVWWFAGSATGCVTVSNPGTYEPEPSRDQPGAQAGQLKAGLVGRQRADADGRFAASFAEDLKRSGIFAQVLNQDEDVDLILDVSVTSFK